MEYKYINFFDSIKLFKEKQQKQKERGLNDYNLLTTVLNEHDEVRLHSRVIGSLLDINGLHYQKELFLENFLEILQVTEFEFNIQESKLFLEYQNIDLYLTDGIKHIIIENKIYAGDQENQIKRYYETIKNENKDLEYYDILIIYLSIDRLQPSKYSLGNLTIEDNYIFDNDEKIAIFKSMNYKNEILNWLDSCLHEIQNITNLNESIQQYKNVVEKITNKYEGKVMTLKDQIAKNEDYYAIAVEIEKEMPKIREEIMTKFFKDTQLKLQTILGNSWEVSIEGKLNTKWGSPLRLIKNSWKDNSKYLFIAFEFDDHNYKSPSFGIVRKDVNGIDLKGIREKFSSELSDIDLVQQKQSTWWLYHQSNDTDLFRKVFFKEYSDNDLVKDLLYYYEHFEKKQSLLSNINKSIIGLES